MLSHHLHHSHPVGGSYATDGFYLHLSQQLLDDFIRSGIDIGESTESLYHFAAALLTSYLEDIVCDSGQWRTFSALCQRMFGGPVPMYHDAEEEYYPDEPSLMAVRYLIYNAATEMDDIWWNPDTPELNQLARIAYQRIDATFEEAPVNDDLTADIDAMLDTAGHDFISMRPALTWLFSGCYVTASATSEELLMRTFSEAKKMGNVMPEARKQRYLAIMHSIFAYKIGPLALYAKDYLAALMHTRGKDMLAADVEAIEVLPYRSYRYTIADGGQWLSLEGTDGSRLQLARDEVTLTNKQLSACDGCQATFVSYQGAWHLNGFMAVLPEIANRWEQLCQADADHLPQGGTTVTADWYLERTGGQQLFFFETPSQVAQYLKTQFRFSDGEREFLNKFPISGKPIVMFIDKSEPKGCLQFSCEFTPCIAAPGNPFYNPETARMEAIEMLWNDEYLTTGVMLYLLGHGYLPEVLTDDLISQSGTWRDRDADAHFLLRYMRREYY